MTQPPKHGGKRPGAGRPRKWNELVMKVRIPKRLRGAFYDWLDKQPKGEVNSDHG